MMTRTRLHGVALATFVASSCSDHGSVVAFQIPARTLSAAAAAERTSNPFALSTKKTPSASSTLLFSSSYTAPSSSTDRLSVERSTPRQIPPFQEWALTTAGVQSYEGFCLYKQEVNDEDGGDLEQYYAATSTGGTAGSCVLYVPPQAGLSANRIAQEYTDMGWDLSASWSALESMGMSDLYLQFVLFTKILVEYQQGASQSPYYPWLDAMPRKWNTAASMDDFCLSCLPPFLKSVCLKDINQLAAFMFALQSLAGNLIQEQTKENNELLKFAYNVVMTRSFPNTATGDVQLMPMVDMLNHGYPGNAYLAYDEAGGCQVVLLQDVAPGEPLLLTYPADGGDSLATNPSQLLATYGFLDETNLPVTYCKLLFHNPSPELLEVGYNNPSQLYFYTENGAIAPAVWDVLLYSRLERKPALADKARAFYNACLQGDETTKSAIHQEYFRETARALQRHVHHILIEVHELTVNMNAYDASRHPRLPLLRKHHAMVTSTFEKVRANLDQMMQQQ